MLSRPWTFALIKPDALANPIAIRWMLDAIHQKGLVIEEGCRLMLSFEKASKLYQVHENAFFYSRLIRHVCSGPVVAMRLEFQGWHREDDPGRELTQEEAIKNWRELLGPSKLFASLYKVECREPDQMSCWRNFRQLFAVSDTRNFGHGSDSLEELQREYSIFEGDMKKVDDPDSELFHLDRYMVLDEGEQEFDD